MIVLTVIFGCLLLGSGVYLVVDYNQCISTAYTLAGILSGVHCSRSLFNIGFILIILGTIDIVGSIVFYRDK